MYNARALTNVNAKTALHTQHTLLHKYNGYAMFVSLACRVLLVSLQEHFIYLIHLTLVTNEKLAKAPQRAVPFCGDGAKPMNQALSTKSIKTH